MNIENLKRKSLRFFSTRSKETQVAIAATIFLLPALVLQIVFAHFFVPRETLTGFSPWWTPLLYAFITATLDMILANYFFGYTTIFYYFIVFGGWAIQIILYSRQMPFYSHLMMVFVGFLLAHFYTNKGMTILKVLLEAVIAGAIGYALRGIIQIYYNATIIWIIASSCICYLLAFILTLKWKHSSWLFTLMMYFLVFLGVDKAFSMPDMIPFSEHNMIVVLLKGAPFERTHIWVFIGTVTFLYLFRKWRER